MEPPEEVWREPPRAPLVLPEGIEAGVIGGLAVAAVFFVRDAWIGDPMQTPSMLGALLVAGSQAARAAAPAAGSAALYHAVHFFAWIAFGFAASGVMRRAERTGARWIALLAAVVALLPLVALDFWVQRAGWGRLHLWMGGLAGIAAMGAFLAWRHPGALRRSSAG
ncbi:MAG: hypothetical protein E4H11_00200 [Myxococcales bacterium]|nr:MAG: hypothetical protein E4H11_00200 [Myxococcales bacterium]